MRTNKSESLIWLIIATLTANLSSCMSDLPGNNEAKGEILSIEVGMPQDENLKPYEMPDSRIAYDDTKLTLVWENGDKLRLVGFDANGHILGTTDFNLTGTPGSERTVFQGPAVTGATHYDIYYLCNDNFPVTKDGKVNMLYTDQNQTADNSISHLKYALFMKSENRVPAEYLKLKTQDIPLIMQNSIMRFDLSNIPSNIQTINSLSWEVVNSKGSGRKDITLTFDDLQISGKKLTGFMCFSDMNIKKNGTIHITLKDSDPSTAENQICTYKLKVNNDITFSANNRYIATIDLHDDVESSSNRFYYKSDVEITPDKFENQPSDEEYDSEDQEGYVDFPFKEDQEIKIKDGAFKGNTDITYLDFQGTLHEVGESAFEGCTNLREVKFPKSLEEIEENAFKGCTSLTKVTLPAIEEIEEGAFEGCTSLQEIILPKTLDEIEEDVFLGCTALKKIVLPPTIEEFKLDAFKTCTALKEIHIKAINVPKVSNYYPFKVTDEQLANPLGFECKNSGLKIYVPRYSVGKYTNTHLKGKLNPWHTYKDIIIGE